MLFHCMNIYINFKPLPCNMLHCYILVCVCVCVCVCTYIYIYIYIGEGNGTPLQYSSLENPMDGGAW